jgi:hypothetical protein
MVTAIVAAFIITNIASFYGGMRFVAFLQRLLDAEVDIEG